MRLEVTRRSDLAVRALRVLAGRGGRIKGPALAAEVGTTTGFVSQVVNPLVRRGWVRSDPGPAGGYSLAAHLADVSVLAVIEAIEGPTESDRCVLVDRPCSETGRCALHVPWLRARSQLLDELDSTSVLDPSIDDSASVATAMVDTSLTEDSSPTDEPCSGGEAGRMEAVVSDLGAVDIAGRAGAVWSLPHGGDLDANLVRLGPDEYIGEHVNDEVDVVVVVQSGRGELIIDGGHHPLGAATIAFIPKGAARRVQAGPSGVTYLSIHRRRPPLAITSSPAEVERPTGVERPAPAGRTDPPASSAPAPRGGAR